MNPPLKLRQYESVYKKPLICAAALALGTLGHTTAQAQIGGVPLWTNRQVSGVAMAVDGSGNVFVTNSGYATVKYSGAGVLLWEYDGGGVGAASAMAVDASGNVFVTGQSASTNDGSDYATIKYSGAGVPLWTNRYNGPVTSGGYASAIAVDGSGNVLVTGSSFNGTTIDFATIKYSGAGVPLWTNRYERGLSAGNDLAPAVAVDDGGNVFIAGTAYTSGNIHDEVAIAYSSTGVPLRTNGYYVGIEYSPMSAASSVAMDGRGNVFVTWSISSSVNVGQSVSATIKYSSSIPPSLTIARTTRNTVALSWPSPSLGFTLQQNTNGIATVNWSNVFATPSDDDTTRTVIVDPTAGNRFYRLFHP